MITGSVWEQFTLSLVIPFKIHCVVIWPVKNLSLKGKIDKFIRYCTYHSY